MMPAKENAAAASILQSDLAARFQGPLMVFFTRRTRDRVLAEDLTQETLLRVIAAQRVVRVEQPESYVFKVAMNLLRDQRRAQARVGAAAFVPIDDAVAGELDRELMEDLSPERVLLSKESLQDVLQTLDELGERTRDIFILFRLERMKQKDIAALFGIGQSTVEKHVMRAVLHLANRYGGRKT
jgi:RNA polymerase sigma factor (sigma-70 family)